MPPIIGWDVYIIAIQTLNIPLPLDIWWTWDYLYEETLYLPYFSIFIGGVYYRLLGYVLSFLGMTGCSILSVWLRCKYRCSIPYVESSLFLLCRSLCMFNSSLYIYFRSLPRNIMSLYSYFLRYFVFDVRPILDVEVSVAISNWNLHLDCLMVFGAIIPYPEWHFYLFSMIPQCIIFILINILLMPFSLSHSKKHIDWMHLL